MRILLVHNYYQQTGGEDHIFETEAGLLESRGHQVLCFTTHNDQIDDMHALAVVGATLWNVRTYRELRMLVRRERPEVVHFHNTFPLVSPAAYYATRDEGVPTVQTLHNYRLLCANGLFFRDGRVCEDCLGKFVPWPGVVHACYRESHAASGVVATMLTMHRLLGTWVKAVDIFIAYSRFTLDKSIQGGLPAEKVMFKTNFVYPDPGPGRGGGGYGLFVGRLTPEKGVNTLLAALTALAGEVPFKIVGDGPLGAQVAKAVERVPGVAWLGQQSLGEVYDLMGEASLLVLPSEWYETCGRVAIEAFARGTPVIVSNIGAIAELVDPGRTGLHFRAGDAEDLAAQVLWCLTHPAELAQMREEARAEFEVKYGAEHNHQRLMEIYEVARSYSRRRA